jgi:hypothetical protein
MMMLICIKYYLRNAVAGTRWAGYELGGNPMQRIFGLAVIALGFAFNFAQSRPALAWGDEGHQIVALVAQTNAPEIQLIDDAKSEWRSTPSPRRNAETTSPPPVMMQIDRKL